MIHGATLIGVFLFRYNFALFLYHPQHHCSAGLCMAAGYEEDSPRTLSRRELMASLKVFFFFFRSCTCYENSGATGLMSGKY